MSKTKVVFSIDTHSVLDLFRHQNLQNRPHRASISVPHAANAKNFIDRLWQANRIRIIPKFRYEWVSLDVKYYEWKE